MSYDVFKQKVDALIHKAGKGISVHFYHDNAKGRHYANCSDGTVIIGNTQSLNVSVRWGSGHAAVATL